jgi:hypothetical protein
MQLDLHPIITEFIDSSSFTAATIYTKLIIAVPSLCASPSPTAGLGVSMGAETNGAGNGKAAAAVERAEDGSTVFRATAYSPLRTTVALALCLGAIHFNAALVLASLFLFPRRLAALYGLSSPPSLLLRLFGPLLAAPDRVNRLFLACHPRASSDDAGCWPRSSSSCSCLSTTRTNWAARSPGSRPRPLIRSTPVTGFFPPAERVT